MLGKALTTAAAGNAGGEVLGVEGVFSTWLYTGNGSTQTITNGIDLSGEGGLVWIKQRSVGNTHRLFDTLRGTEIALSSASTLGNTTRTGSLTAFNSDGFDLGNDSTTNGNGETHASWTFRKAEKFFDVVTWTGSGANRTISHNLGSVPGCIFVKRTDTTGDWQVYHRSLANTEYMVLNSTATKATGTTRWNSTTPTSTEFSLGTDATVNASGGTYVAYLFAHDAGGFGDSGSDSIIKCGSYTGNGSTTGPVIDLGWEPQWVLIKRTTVSTASWVVIDNMRGMTVGNDSLLYPNNAAVEDSSDGISPLATGFQPTTTGVAFNASGSTYIYIAIRRGPMKTPTDATKVFQVSTYAGTGTANRSLPSSFPVDFALWTSRNGSGYSGTKAHTRLTGSKLTLQTDSANAESSIWDTVAYQAFNNDNVIIDSSAYGYNSTVVTQALQWLFRRAPGFFDVVAYTGDGGTNRNISHSLGVIPELIIIKTRSNADPWGVRTYGSGNTDRTGLSLNATTEAQNAGFGTLGLSTTTFNPYYVANASSGNYGANTYNLSSRTYIAYLFATCPGVSKVGSYTGTGTTLSINCGFTSGARFVMIKRTDSTGDWYVWDTARGIVSGNDPYLLLNSTAAENTSTDYIDPLSSGFQISSSAPAAINANGGSYIYLAIA